MTRFMPEEQANRKRLIIKILIIEALTGCAINFVRAQSSVRTAGFLVWHKNESCNVTFRQ